MKEILVHRRIGLGPWRLVVAAGFSIKRRGQQVEARSEPADEEAFRTPQYEAWLRRKARMREESLLRELGA